MSNTVSRRRWLIKRIVFLGGFMSGETIAVSIEKDKLPRQLEFMPVTDEQKRLSDEMLEYCNPDGSSTYYGYQDCAEESVYKIGMPEWKVTQAKLEERHRREREIEERNRIERQRGITRKLI